MEDKVQNKIVQNSINNKIVMNATVEITSLCNWNCRHCYLGGHANRGLEFKTILNVFRQLRELGTYELTLTGGEVFLRTDIFDIIESARNMGFCVNIFSNISLLDEMKIKRLKKANINKVSCTIFSLDRKIHDNIAQIDGALESVLNNIKLLKQYQIPIEVKNCITSLNKNEYRKIIRFCRENNLEVRLDTDVTPVRKMGRQENICKLTIEEEQVLAKDLDVLQQRKYEEHNFEEYICPDIRNSISIDCNGNIKPCIKYEYTIGNVYITPIKRVWEENTKLIEMQEQKWGDIEKCKKCSYNAYCFQCPIRSMLDDIPANKEGKTACRNAKWRHYLYT